MFANDERGPTALSDTETSPLDTHRTTVLVVEDNTALAALVQQQLALLGYRTITVGTADAALQVLRSGARVDLLFSDIMLPGSLDGRSLALAAQGLHPALPCLLTTGYEELDSPTRRATEHVHVLAKPYRRAELARAVREALARR